MLTSGLLGSGPLRVRMWCVHRPGRGQASGVSGPGGAPPETAEVSSLPRARSGAERGRADLEGRETGEALRGGPSVLPKGHSVSHRLCSPSARRASQPVTSLPPPLGPPPGCPHPPRRLTRGTSRRPAGPDKGLFCADSHQDAILHTALDSLLVPKSAPGPQPEGSVCLPARGAGVRLGACCLVLG